jgi:hypothetical protein
MAPPSGFGSDLNTRQREGAWRNAGRFPLQCEMSFRLMDKQQEPAGKGRTVNMSSRGLLFYTDKKLAVGEPIEVTVRWPFQSGHECATDLIGRGKVVRARGGMVAVSIEKCEFRKVGRGGSAL